MQAKFNAPQPAPASATLPVSKCKVCRRPTATAYCGPCRAWHRYLSAIGSLAEVRS
jgi:hypothetical protein